MGTPTSKEQINEWKMSGAYHDMFSKHPYAIVPEYILGTDELLEQGITGWLEEVKRQAFDEGGKPIRFGQQNAILISSLEKLETIAKNALTRFKSARHAPKPAPFPTAPIERQLLCLAGHQLRTCT